MGKSILLVTPYLVLSWFFAMAYDYSTYLDADLHYRTPGVAAAPEDILGFGIWVMWILGVVPLGVSATLTYRYATRNRAYHCVLSVSFLLLSAAAYVLYRILERQVIGR